MKMDDIYYTTFAFYLFQAPSPVFVPQRKTPWFEIYHTLLNAKELRNHVHTKKSQTFFLPLLAKGNQFISDNKKNLRNYPLLQDQINFVHLWVKQKVQFCKK